MSCSVAKPHFVQITDAGEAAALRSNGKYDNANPHWVFRGGIVWALVDEQLKAWRARRAAAVQIGSSNDGGADAG